LASLDIGIIKKIIISWFTTVPFTAALAMLFYKAFLLFLP